MVDLYNLIIDRMVWIQTIEQPQIIFGNGKIPNWIYPCFGGRRCDTHSVHTFWYAFVCGGRFAIYVQMKIQNSNLHKI